MKNRIIKDAFLVFFVLSTSFNLLADEIGTRMWDACVRDKRPLGVLFTVTGMATAPLLMPLPIPEIVEDLDLNWFTGSIAGFGVGTLWMLGYELSGVVDILTIGWLSCDGTGGDCLGHVGEKLIKPAYCYYIDEIEHAIKN